MNKQFIVFLNRPEYIFRPVQIYHRLFNKTSQSKKEFDNLLLPWGVELKIPTDSDDKVGYSISTQGIYDLSVTEVLWRLINQGDTAVDIGANIGYMTSIMAKRVGKTGKVWCFEPNNQVYEELLSNISNWYSKYNWNHIYCQQLALSNKSGVGLLKVPQKNREKSSLIEGSDSIKETQELNGCKIYKICLKTLNEIFDTSSKIGVVKIDVEGHELEVLQGATDLISKQRIRDIIFENHYGYPSPVTQLLEEYGYTIFRIWKGFWKPLLKPPTNNLVHPWEPPNYLATKEPKRAIKHLKKRGWNSLTGK
jgi:FkbM family methyltransferase